MYFIDIVLDLLFCIVLYCFIVLMFFLFFGFLIFSFVVVYRGVPVRAPTGLLRFNQAKHIQKKCQTNDKNLTKNVKQIQKNDKQNDSCWQSMTLLDFPAWLWIQPPSSSDEKTTRKFNKNKTNKNTRR